MESKSKTNLMVRGVGLSSRTFSNPPHHLSHFVSSYCQGCIERAWASRCFYRQPPNLPTHSRPRKRSPASQIFTSHKSPTNSRPKQIIEVLTKQLKQWCLAGAGFCIFTFVLSAITCGLSRINRNVLITNITNSITNIIMQIQKGKKLWSRKVCIVISIRGGGKKSLSRWRETDKGAAWPASASAPAQ